MPKFSPIPPKKLLKILEKKGYFVDHQTGSHMILHRDNQSVPIVLPMHNRDMKIGLIKSILSQADISSVEYEMLRKKRKY